MFRERDLNAKENALVVEEIIFINYRGGTLPQTGTDKYLLNLVLVLQSEISCDVVFSMMLNVQA
tara:strand:+ start:109 stop:300 length:192 start_codon:yes stop_codon:yes gene_type:complete